MDRRYSNGPYYMLFDKQIHLKFQPAIIAPECRVRWWMTLTEIYAGLWALQKPENRLALFKLFPGMRSIVQDWLQNSEFCDTEEGMLAMLAMELGRPVSSEGIAQLSKKEIFAGS